MIQQLLAQPVRMASKFKVEVAFLFALSLIAQHAKQKAHVNHALEEQFFPIVEPHASITAGLLVVRTVTAALLVLVAIPATLLTPRKQDASLTALKVPT